MGSGTIFRSRKMEPGPTRSIGVDAHEGVAFGALLAELHAALFQGEQRVIGADTDVGASTHRGTALADQDVAGNDVLAAVLLHAQTFAVRIAAVTGTAACLFVCHVSEAPGGIVVSAPEARQLGVGAQT